MCVGGGGGGGALVGIYKLLRAIILSAMQLAINICVGVGRQKLAAHAILVL